MKISESWLRTWVNPSINTDTLVAQLTMAGLEVDAVEPVAGQFSGVVVAEVVSCEPHPNADKLRLCQVSDGSEQFQVVCGAPNVRAGLKIPFAKIGAILPGDFKIKKAKLRQIESFGMLCSEKELGLSDAHEGLMELAENASVGQDIRQYLQLDDMTIEVDLTPNRADCLSIQGIARDVGVFTRTNLTPIEVPNVAAEHNEVLPITLDAPAACPRFLGRIIKGIELNRATPLWMVERLRRSGLRSISPAVDVTNYVMIELGQPMHAYDLATLKQGIRVRMAQAGERLTLLDGSELELTENSLLIADEEKPLGLAGIMGGEHSGITDETQDIFLEVAYFQPEAIAGKARSYGLHTDASHRFERGVDFELQRRAIERASALLIEICGGSAGPVTEAISEHNLPKRQHIELRQSRLTQLLGMSLEASEVLEILIRLGLKAETTEAGWQIKAPSYRFDIAIEADLIEEVARVQGYNNLPSKSALGSAHLKRSHEQKLSLRTLKRQLVAEGYQEAITYSFVELKLQQLLDPESKPLTLLNPISSDLAVMRTNLWPGLINAVQHNLNRQQTRVALFETGLRFVPDANGLIQQPVIAGAISGSRFPESWANDRDKVDFFDVKGTIERLLDLGAGSETYRFESDSHPALHPGQSARIRKGDQWVGWAGLVHPHIQKALGYKQPIYVFEVEQKSLLTCDIPQYQKLSKHPEVQRDLAFTVNKSVKAADLKALIKAQAGEYLLNTRIFDLYQGEGIDPQRKSIAMGLTWQHPSRTLNDEEINSWMTAIIDALQQEVDAQLRG
jgi:phenylalanyl-tRNA synthetase beta chain